ncbi:YbdD/YjiX family protein [Streptomyces sp. AJS327]|uniref:CstA-like transporter-associated (seleno)protein n=1 Tax=Streptomyces sp. AJS327 TaxID=2545265 RepID=UPI0015DDACC0|nr:YbdD/YjiX family protein [Streptomyces sp. AJS327]
MRAALRAAPSRALRTVRWYLREISGTADYERFRQRHAERHPGEPVPSRKEYERYRTRHREENPQSRCC